MSLLRPITDTTSLFDIVLRYRGRELPVATYHLEDWLYGMQVTIHAIPEAPQWLLDASAPWETYHNKTDRLYAGYLLDLDMLLPTDAHQQAFDAAIRQFQDAMNRSIRRLRRRKIGLYSRRAGHIKRIGDMLVVQQFTALVRELLQGTLHPALQDVSSTRTVAILRALIQIRPDGWMGYGIIKLPEQGIGGGNYWINPANQHVAIRPPKIAGHAQQVIGIPDVLFHTVYDSDEPDRITEHDVELRNGVQEVWRLSFAYNQIWLYTSPRTRPLIFPGSERVFSSAMNDYLDLQPIFELQGSRMHWLMALGED